MVAADARSAKRSSCLPLRGDHHGRPWSQASLDPVFAVARSAVDILTKMPASIVCVGDEVTTKRGFDPLGRCSASATINWFAAWASSSRSTARNLL
jgi:hypothetical protein